jgi:thiol-disulfide isomerase/thioredoxin
MRSSRSHPHRSRSRQFRWLAPTLLLLSLPFTSSAVGQTVSDVHSPADETLKQGRGKVQVFIFVRTDCPIANRYAPVLQEMQKRYGKTVLFRLVFPDKSESAGKIREYLHDYGYDFPALRDVDHALVKVVSAKVTPEAAVFDAGGQLVYHGRIDNLYEHLGQARRLATTHELADAVEAARKGTNPPVSSVGGVGCFIADLE